MSHSIKFSSGPCKKFTEIELSYGFSSLGRSHRSNFGLSRINRVISLLRKTLEIPEDYKIAIISGSETGAMECLLWNLLGYKNVDVLQTGVFSNHWYSDIADHLKIRNVRKFSASCFDICDFRHVNFDHDVVLCLTETTTSVAFENLDWVQNGRKGLTICDATSAVFCQKIDWEKLDATSFSWQKGIGGEAGLGCIVLSPNAVERLNIYNPEWPVPRIFRLCNNGILNEGIFEGKTINTPSMLCIEDMIRTIKHVEARGGIDYLFAKISENYDVSKKAVLNSKNLEFCVKDEKIRAKHIICIDITADSYKGLDEKNRWLFLQKLCDGLCDENIAYDILGHILAKPHLRLWAGPTINSNDIETAIEKIDQYVSIKQ